MGSLSLRVGTLDDAPILSQLIRSAFQEYDGVLDPPSGARKETPEKIRVELSERTEAVLALLDGEPVGCALFRDEGSFMYIGRLSVLPTARGHGISSALMDYVEGLAGERGIPRMQLGVRLALQHIRARYEQRGYYLVEERCHEGYTYPTMAVMEKDITPIR